ncbi:PTS sugar transporter subunit IIC, partial [Streptococcus pneumoniae]
TPAILSGFLVGGWQGVITQLVILAMSTLVYFPFFKIQDVLYFRKK